MVSKGCIPYATITFSDPIDLVDPIETNGLEKTIVLFKLSIWNYLYFLY